VKTGGGLGVHALQFMGIKPDAAAATVTNIEGHAAVALLAQLAFASWTFHGSIGLKV